MVVPTRLTPSKVPQRSYVPKINKKYLHSQVTKEDEVEAPDSVHVPDSFICTLLVQLSVEM